MKQRNIQTTTKTAKEHITQDETKHTHNYNLRKKKITLTQ